MDVKTSCLFCPLWLIFTYFSSIQALVSVLATEINYPAFQACIRRFSSKKKLWTVHFVQPHSTHSGGIQGLQGFVVFLCKDSHFVISLKVRSIRERREDLFCLKIQPHWGPTALAFAWQCHCLWDGLPNMQSCNPTASAANVNSASLTLLESTVIACSACLGWRIACSCCSGWNG